MKADLLLADPNDWCTVGWAAEKLVLTERQVRRMVAEGLLRKYYPRRAKSESGRWAGMLYVAEVERHAQAREVVAGRA
jgi:hypothetical protein